MVWTGDPSRTVTSGPVPGFHGRYSRASWTRSSLTCRDERTEVSCSMLVRFVRLLVGEAFCTSRLVIESAPSPLVLMNDPVEFVILLRVKSRRPDNVLALFKRWSMRFTT